MVETQWIRGTGKIKYDPPRGDMKRKTKGWCIIEVDREITRYYRWWIDREIFNKTGVDGFGLCQPSWDAHISIIRGEGDLKKVPAEKLKKLWKKYDGKTIEFFYKPDVHNVGKNGFSGDNFFWSITVKCDFGKEMREELGLPSHWNFHLTVGRYYEETYCKLERKLLKHKNRIKVKEKQMGIAENLKSTTLRLRKDRDELAASIQQVQAFAQSLAKERGLKEGDMNTPFNDDEAVRAVQKGIKQVNDTIASLEQAGGTDSELYRKSLREREILESLLPKMASDDEVNASIEKFISSVDAGSVNIKLMGQIMKHLGEEFGASLDKAKASQLVKARLA